MKHFLLSLILLPLTAFGQEQQLRHYPAYDHLWANAVRTLAQGRDGFIYVGADAGLFRFDGVQMLNLSRRAGQTQTVTALTVMGGDSIMVGTLTGLYVFDTRSLALRRFAPTVRSRVTALTQDRDGALWISTERQGVWRWRQSAKSLTHFALGGGERVSGLFADRDNRLWAMTRWGADGLWLLNRAHATFRPFRPGGKAAPRSTAMTESADGRLWLATWTEGLIVFDAADATVSARYLTPAADYAHHPHSIRMGGDGTMFVCCDNGLKTVRPIGVPTPPVEFGALSPATIYGSFVYATLEDHEGGMWVGTFFSGLNYLPAISRRFQVFKTDRTPATVSGNVISRFAEDAVGNIYIASDDGGLTRYTPGSGVFSHIALRAAGLAGSNVHALCFEPPHTLWVGTYGAGVYALDLRSGTQRIYRSLTGKAGTLYDNSSYTIFRDHRGELFVATAEGVCRYRPASDDFVRLRRFASYAGSMTEDDQGRLWFATQGDGVWRLDATRRRWRHYDRLPSPVVNSLLSSERGQLFAATDRGLLLYDTRRDTFRYATPADTTAVGFIVEQGGAFWLATPDGLCRRAKGEPTHTFSAADGLSTNHLMDGGAFVASDGRIYIGSADGFNCFYPYQIKVNERRPRMAVTGLTLPGGESHSLGQGVERVTLTADEGRAFTITFAALSFQTPEKNRYAYRLDGFDRQWNSAGNGPQATYTNLAPGTYTFRVRGTNNDGVWCESDARLRITIEPPFYWSLPAKLLYLLIVVALAFWVARWTIERQRQRHKEQQLRFFTMVAHEIRTPVTLITGPVESLLKATTLTEEQRGSLAVIDRNAHRLLDLVNQLLDFRKVSRQTYEMHYAPTNVRRLIEAVTERFAPTFEGQGTEFTVTLPDASLTAVIDPEAITKVVSNLLTNARKYTRDRVELTVAATPDDEHFTIRVADNGLGIAHADRRRIFQAFYQAAGNKPGTGIGLNIVENIVKAHGGTITVQSEPGQGATFTVTLPIDLERRFPTCVTGSAGWKPAQTRSEKFQPAQAEERAADAALRVGNAQAPVTQVGNLRSSDDTQMSPTVLLIDDNEDMLAYLAQNFADVGSVLTAHDGIEALDMIAHNDVGLIVSDWMMPRMDGAELCRRVRADAATSHIPFILLTAKVDDASKTEGMNVGADAYIEKPFSMEYLRACCRNCLAMRERLRAKFSSQPLEPITHIAQSDTDRSLLTKMERVIADNFDNPDLNVDFLADKLCLSRSRLFAKIKTLAGVTPLEMIQMVRLKKAAALLAEGGRKVSEVCYMVGFNSPSYFAKCFQRQFGMTPSEFLTRGASLL